MSEHIHIEQRLHELRQIAAEYAKAEADKTYLEHFRHSKLAILMKRYAKIHPTSAAQDREARADDEYLALLDGLKVATEEAVRLRWELEIAKMGASLYQTSQANKRAELGAYR